MKFSFAVILLICWQGLLIGQEITCTGKVLDDETGKTLAFVNIVSNNSKTGTSTDIDGKFTLRSKEKIEFLSLSYVGYEPQTHYLHGDVSGLVIRLKKTTVELSEVVIVAGDNPAHRIIRNVIDNRNHNDPEKRKSFAYTSYDKMIFTVDTNDIPDEAFSEPDSSNIRFRKFLKEKDFFMMETVSERKFLAPDKNHEKVLASRISGFKDPVFLFLASQLQTPSFYKDMIRIGDKKFISPISPGSLRKYFFQLEDTSYTAQNDTVFIISYRPGINTNFDGLKGVLSINTNGWAIQNVIAEPSRKGQGLSVKIQQLYELIDGEHWFPVQLNTDIIFQHVEVNKFAPVGRGKSYLRDIVLNPELVKRQFNQISIEVDPMAGDRSEAYWFEYRGDSLTEREKATYHYIDSIGREANLDRIATTVKSLLSNRLPMGYVDLDLTKIVNYNSYEGFYLGLGLLTSKKLSQTFGLGAFWGYGFKDQRAKYGVDLEITADKYRELKFRFGYFDYVTESGGVAFFDDNNSLLDPANFRNLLIKEMDITTRKHVSVQFRAMRYASLSFGLKSDLKKSKTEYVFDPVEGGNPEGSGRDGFRFTEINAGIRYAFKEKFLQMPDSRISLGTKYPVIWLNYTRGLSGFLDGAYEYDKIDLKIQKLFYFKYVGESRFDIRAGWINNPIPMANLYNGRGAYRVFTIYAPGSFATERMNEFLADRYLYCFYTHDFGKLLWRGKKFSPEFAVATNVGFGWLNNPEYHKNVQFNIMDQGYIESGLNINNLLNLSGIYSLGIGAFYRYGFYSLPKQIDNFAFKIVLEFPFMID